MKDEDVEQTHSGEERQNEGLKASATRRRDQDHDVTV